MRRWVVACMAMVVAYCAIAWSAGYLSHRAAMESLRACSDVGEINRIGVNDCRTVGFMFYDRERARKTQERLQAMRSAAWAECAGATIHARRP